MLLFIEEGWGGTPQPPISDAHCRLYITGVLLLRSQLRCQYCPAFTVTDHEYEHINAGGRAGQNTKAIHLKHCPQMIWLAVATCTSRVWEADEADEFTVDRVSFLPGSPVDFIAAMVLHKDVKFLINPNAGAPWVRDSKGQMHAVGW